MLITFFHKETLTVLFDIEIVSSLCTTENPGENLILIHAG